MRVAMIAPYPRLPGRPNGGVEAAVEKLAPAVARCGLEVRVFDPFTGYEEMPNSTGHTVVRLAPLRPWRAVVPLAASRVDKHIKAWKPDLVHVHLGAQYTRIQAPSVLTVHGFPHLETRLRNPGIAGSIRSIPLKFAFYHGVKGASSVVAISPEAEQAAGKAGVRSVSIPNPIAEEFYSMPRNPGEDFVAVGNIMRRKNQLQLIQAFGRYVAMGFQGDLAIIGEVTDQDYYAECLIAANPFLSRVHFLGPLPRAEVASLLSTARASISTSLRETSSIAIAESFAANCPVVCLDTGTARQQIKDTRFGRALDLESSVNEIALEMHRVGSCFVDGEPLRDSVANQHPDAVAKETVRLYQSLL